MVICNKDLYLYTILDQHRLDIIYEVEFIRSLLLHDRLHIYPLCGIFFWHRHQIEIKPTFPLAWGMSRSEKLLVPKKNH